MDGLLNDRCVTTGFTLNELHTVKYRVNAHMNVDTLQGVNVFMSTTRDVLCSYVF